MKNRVEYVPAALLRLYGANGMCAGNSMEEALVHGICETMERHVHIRIIEQRLTPPIMPESELRKMKVVYPLIERIRGSAHHKLIIKDCALSKGFPVFAAILINQKNQSYSASFGAHPCPEIALERTLTELFQGRGFSELRRLCVFAYGNESLSFKYNIWNLLKAGVGAYPNEFFTSDYTYDVGITDWSNVGTNRSMLRSFEPSDQRYSPLKPRVIRVIE